MKSSFVFALLSLHAMAAPAKCKPVDPGYDVEKVKDQVRTCSFLTKIEWMAIDWLDRW